MSVIVNNLLAMNAQRQLGINTDKKNKSTERLSSGYRINRAADDAAGLAISEKMRGQIRGLNRASVNSQDGISLIQTAEGAMQESQNILHRMRELAVQAANDVNTEEDRNCIKLELDQMAQELDRIANSTEYNTMKLIDGTYSMAATDTKTKFQEYLKGSWLQDALTRIQDGLGIGIDTNATLTVTFKQLAPNVVAQMGSYNGGNIFSLEVNTDFTDSLTMNDFTTSSGPLAGGILVDRLITHEMTHAVTRHNMTAATNAPTWFMEGIAEAVQGHGRTNPQTPNQALSNILTGDPYEKGYYAVSYMAYNTTSGTFQDFLKEMKTGKTFDELINKYYGKANEAAFIDAIEKSADADINGFLQSCHITLGDGLEDSIIDWDRSAEDVVLNMGGPESIRSSTETLSLSGHTWTVTWDSPETSGDKIVLQTGANSGQELKFDIGDMRRSSLIGTEEIDVSNHDMASAQISRFNGGIQRVSRYRSILGSVQNRLEHGIQYLDNTNENLTASESRIRDTDMPKEMTSFSISNILSQAGESMLAQANQTLQGVLQLLEQS